MSSAVIDTVAYSSAWPSRFERESSRISSAIGGVLVAIHHIGSTSIPLCDAKPIIDMVAAVTDLELLDEVSTAMEGLGYEAMGEFGIPGRRYFRKGSSFENRTHQIHAFQHGSPEIDRHLAFRDFLRAHPALVAEYVALKRRLAAAHPTDVPAYTAAKSEFIRRIEGLATANSSLVVIR